MIDTGWLPRIFSNPARERELERRATQLVRRYHGKRKRLKALRRFMRFLRNRPGYETKSQQWGR